MTKIADFPARLANGRIVASIEPHQISGLVLDVRKIVILKGVFPIEMSLNLRRAVVKWGQDTAAATTNDFRGNYHRQRVQLIKQRAPHVFHDYNFNDFAKLEADLHGDLLSLFDPLRVLYNELNSYETQFTNPPSGPFIQPQIIHYPAGGGFFARHEHDFQPQRIGIIAHLSRFGIDYRNGGTVFEIDGESVNLEGVTDIGDICIWRFDYPHWVTQSDLKDQFDWCSEKGRWVATFPYNDPFLRV